MAPNIMKILPSKSSRLDKVNKIVANIFIYFSTLSSCNSNHLDGTTFQHFIALDGIIYLVPLCKISIHLSFVHIFSIKSSSNLPFVQVLEEEVMAGNRIWRKRCRWKHFDAQSIEFYSNYTRFVLPCSVQYVKTTSVGTVFSFFSTFSPPPTHYCFISGV